MLTVQQGNQRLGLPIGLMEPEENLERALVLNFYLINLLPIFYLYARCNSLVGPHK